MCVIILDVDALFATLRTLQAKLSVDSHSLLFHGTFCDGHLNIAFMTILNSSNPTS